MDWIVELPASDWWDFLVAGSSAFLGAILGGASSYLLAVRTSREALTKEREERARTQHDRIFSVFLELSECLADALDHLREIERQVAENKLVIGDSYAVSSAVQPIANLDFIGEFNVPSADLLVFVEGGEVEFAQQIRHRLKQYNSIVECLKKFTSLKEDFGKYIEHQAEISLDPMGRIAGQVPRHVAERIEAKRAQMENVIVQTRLHLRETSSDLIELASEFGPKAKNCTPEGLRVVAFTEEELIALRNEMASLPDLR